jgi:hypothetical protein
MSSFGSSGPFTGFFAGAHAAASHTHATTLCMREL